MAPKSNILRALEELNKKDIYSLILFVLYKLKDNPNYSTLSELIYILDNDSFSRFLAYYGGSTITIPTIDDVRKVFNAICFFERKNNTEMSDDEILADLNIKKKDYLDILNTVSIIENLLEEYDFKRNIT